MIDVLEVIPYEVKTAVIIYKNNMNNLPLDNDQ